MNELHDSSLSAGSSSPKKQTELEVRDGFVSGGIAVQKSLTTENEHIGLVEVNVRQSDCGSVDNLKILNNSTKDSSFGSTKIESLELKQDVAHDIDMVCSAETGVAAELPRLENLNHSNGEQIGLVKEDPISNFNIGDFRLPHENGETICTFDNLGSASGDASEILGLQQSEPTEKDASNVAGELALEKGTSMRSRKQKSSVLPPVSNRILRSRSKETPKSTDSKAAEVEDTANERRKRKQRMKGQTKNVPVNEFSKIRTHLRYLLHRIKYEQNLIEAYSGEGWKGQSLEKIKPEKELQRARFQILRYKLKIRDLFQCLDGALTQGKLPETLFDSEGQIDSEDIFCAKCGSKDLTLENDIILCDGACERGFHQFCLDPPLSKEDIPPGDEGWLCPGCDCKVDCVEMLNDYQESTLSVLDNWEKVFPEEAAAAASGKSLDDIDALPSDDSEDDDYTPCDAGLDNEVSVDKSSPDGSDYFSASDDVVPSGNKQNLDLPSDDSEDDEYDPSAPDHDQHAKQESSGSDFTSDSEDLEAILEDGELSDKDEEDELSLSGHCKPNAVNSGGKLKAGKPKRVSLSDELSYLTESNAMPVSGKRKAERLDYKKLHDETYGNTTSDSSDEDYGGTDGPKRRESSARKAIRISTDEVQYTENGTDTLDGNQNQKEDDHTVEEEGQKKLKVQRSNEKLGESQRSSSEAGSSSKSASRPYKRLGEAVIQKLLESFRENQYPKQDVKESLAKELGLKVQQVSKWFENARWSFRHSARMESKMAGAAATNGASSPTMKEIPLLQSPSCNGEENIASSQVNPVNEDCQTTDAGEGKSVSEASGKNCRQRKSKVDGQGSGAENFPKQDVPADTPKSHAVRKSGRIQNRSSNSVE